MNILKELWAAYPLEVAIYGAIAVFSSVGFAVCLLALLISFEEMEADELVDAD